MLVRDGCIILGCSQFDLNYSQKTSTMYCIIYCDINFLVEHLHQSIRLCLPRAFFLSPIHSRVIEIVCVYLLYSDVCSRTFYTLSFANADNRNDQIQSLVTYTFAHSNCTVCGSFSSIRTTTLATVFRCTVQTSLALGVVRCQAIGSDRIANVKQR